MSTAVAGAKTGHRTAILVRVGVLAAVGFILMLLEFPSGMAPHLQFDVGDLPALLGGFAMGPVAGLAVVFVRNAIFFFSGKDEAGWIGTLASLVSSLCLVGVAAVVYHQYHTLKGAILGLVGGILAATVVMVLANYYFFIPMYLGKIETSLLLQLLRVTALFNLAKGSMNAAATFLVYKRVRALLR
ncbi:MAG: ECF transporter S component [bacterium]|nr:ECF transporter S component [bacterium]